MAKIEAWLSCDLKKPVQVQGLSGNVFSMDNNGSRINVRIYDNGEKTTVSGSVTANCILADGSTINVNGSLTTDNGQSVAYVDIPQSCLLVPGPIRIAIKLTASGVITTLAAVVTTVYRTQTDIVITPSAQIITDWNAEISAAIATQNATIANQDTKINDLKSAIGDDESSIRNLLLSVIGKGISDEVTFTSENGSFSGEVGSAIEIGTQTTWKHTSVAVSADEVYAVIFKTTGNASNKNEYVAFTNNSNIILAKAGIPEDTQIYTSRIVKVPSGATKMYVRSFATSVSAISIYKVKDTMSNVIIENEENIGKLSDATEYVNKFSFNFGVTTQTVSGVTFSIDENGILTVNGTPSEKIHFDIMGGKRTENIRNIIANVPIIAQRELISGTANGFPVFRNTYDYAQSTEGSAVELDKTFIPTANGCLFLRINTGTSFTNAKFKFSVSIGAVKYTIVPHKLSAIDLSLREKLKLEDESKTVLDNTIQSKNRMLFSAHRGAEGQAPYGSYPSYELACQQGWDMIQIAQARQSADGTWYCLHDESVDAQTNGTGNIASLSDSYIDGIYQDVGVNIGQYTHEQMKLPTLESVLKLAYRYGVMVSIRLGSLPNYDGQGTIPTSWTSFINLCKKYRPERMMFSGTYDQIRTLKAFTPNWHGEVYIVTADVQATIDALKANGYTNCSILVVESKVNQTAIQAAHDAGYYFVTAQVDNPTVEKFIEYSNMGVDIAQTGISSVHSIAE